MTADGKPDFDDFPQELRDRVNACIPPEEQWIDADGDCLLTKRGMIAFLEALKRHAPERFPEMDGFIQHVFDNDFIPPPDL